MISVNSDLSQAWLKQYLPNASFDQKQIFSKWVDRISSYYQSSFPKGTFQTETEFNQFLEKKVLLLFYPHFFLQSSPFELPAIEQAIEILRDAFSKKDTARVVLFGDRDVDGVSSSSILFLFLRDIMRFNEKNLFVELPHKEDKYGLSNEVIERMFQHKPDILITLDCGSSNKESLEYFRSLSPNTKQIILDHHFIPEQKEDYPCVDAFVNPKQLEATNSVRDLCTAGLAFKLIWALTYSYTSEYNQTYELVSETGSIFVRNGVQVEAKTTNAKRVYFVNAQADGIDGAAIWANLAKTNKYLHAVDQFSAQFDNVISDLEKLRTIQNLQLGNVYTKIKPYLSLAGIGTIADLMPLVDDNRILVSQGINLIKQQPEILPVGLKELLKKLSLLGVPIYEQDLSFTVCPSLNAPGRLGEPQKALASLISKDPLESAKAAFEVYQINEKRKKLSDEGSNKILNNLNNEHEAFPIVVAYHSDIHRGISGIVASKLAETLKKPAIVMVNDGDCIRGSARAYQSDNVFSLLQNSADYFLQFGGHRQAAGFSLPYENIDAFKKHVYSISKELLGETQEVAVNFNEFVPPLEKAMDNILSKNWSEWLAFAPYGVLNPHPTIAVPKQGNVDYTLMGDAKNHARLNFSNVIEKRIEGVWFNHKGETHKLEEDHLTLIAEPHYNHFRGQVKYQLKIKELKIF